jgi:hypothetical protein
MATDEQIKAQWEQVAIEIGDSVYRAVNTPETVGTDDETGYLLMFFNRKNHRGQSTMVSTVSRAETKKLLKTAILNLYGPKAKIVEPQRAN